MKYTVDRIDDGYAVCEDENEKIVNFELNLLPEDVKEGNIIEKTDNGFVICSDETAERRKKMAALQNSIFTKRK